MNKGTIENRRHLPIASLTDPFAIYDTFVEIHLSNTTMHICFQYNCIVRSGTLMSADQIRILRAITVNFGKICYQ